MSTTLLARPDDTHRQVLDDVEAVLGQLFTPTDASAGPAGSAPDRVRDPVGDPLRGVGGADPDRALPGQCRSSLPRELGVSELWVSCLACEAELVAELNRATAPAMNWFTVTTAPTPGGSWARGHPPRRLSHSGALHHLTLPIATNRQCCVSDRGADAAMQYDLVVWEVPAGMD